MIFQTGFYPRVKREKLGSQDRLPRFGHRAHYRRFRDRIG